MRSHGYHVGIIFNEYLSLMGTGLSKSIFGGVNTLKHYQGLGHKVRMWPEARQSFCPDHHKKGRLYQPMLSQMPDFEIISLYSILNPLMLIKIPSSGERINCTNSYQGYAAGKSHA